MAMRLYTCALAMMCVANAMAATETYRLKITFAGADAGENVYTISDDGSFTSTTDLSIGSLKLVSKMSGKWAGSTLAEYRFENDSTGTGKKALLVFRDGKLHVTSGKFDKDVPLDVKGLPYFGNLHPQFTASVLGKVDFTKKTSQEFKAFCPDAGSTLSPKWTPLGEKVTRSGVAKLYDMQLVPVAATYAMDSSNHIVAFDVPGQKLRFYTPGWESLFTNPLDKYPELSQPNYKYKIDKGVKMKTRDGVTLVLDIVRPDSPGKFPVILERTPYGRSASAAEGPFYATRGYVFAVEDCRGRSDSGGKWDPFVYDRKDGFDTVQWAAKQPWSDGNVGMIGASYGGFVQWEAAVENPPALKCIVPQVSPPDPFFNIPYENGVFFLYGGIWWSKIVAGKEADMSSFMSALPNPNGFKTLPLSKVDKAVLGQTLPFYQEWLKRTSHKDWTGANFQDDMKNIKIPALHVSGWFDGDEIGTMTNWSHMRELGRKNQWLVYGPWTHLFNSTSKIGDTDFGPDAVIDLDSVYLRWFDTWLKHKQVHLEKIPHVQIFVMGANKWVSGSDWPLTQSKKTTWYLGANGSAEPMISKGKLLATPPKAQSPTGYTFDPKVDAIDKQFVDPDPNHVSFVVNVDKRLSDSILFKSEPVAKPTTVTGPFVCNLYFSTSAKDTDFFANLYDVLPDGKIKLINEPGKIRCSYLQGWDKQKALKPGKIYHAQIRLWDSAYELKPGHGLAILIRSGMFPMFARNLGTTDPIATATKMVVQKQLIYHDAKHPSSVSFQVLQ